MTVLMILPQLTPAAVRLEFPYDEITVLALDLMRDELCIQLLEARSHALVLQNELATYAAAWDHSVARARNADALSG